MKPIAALTLAAALLASPLPAQERLPETPEEEEEGGLLQRGAELFLRGLIEEFDPALRELEDLAGEMEPALRSFAEEMGPALRGLMDEVGDWSRYHPPEMLPNGDIILRRKPDTQEPLPLPERGGEIEL